MVLTNILQKSWRLFTSKTSLFPYLTRWMWQRMKREHLLWVRCTTGPETKKATMCQINTSSVASWWSPNTEPMSKDYQSAKVQVWFPKENGMISSLKRDAEMWVLRHLPWYRIDSVFAKEGSDVPPIVLVWKWVWFTWGDSTGMYSQVPIIHSKWWKT